MADVQISLSLPGQAPGLSLLKVRSVGNSALPLASFQLPETDDKEEEKEKLKHLFKKPSLRD